MATAATTMGPTTALRPISSTPMTKRCKDAGRLEDDVELTEVTALSEVEVEVEVEVELVVK